MKAGTEPKQRLASSHAQGPISHAPRRPGTSLFPSVPSFHSSQPLPHLQGARRGRQGTRGQAARAGGRRRGWPTDKGEGRERLGGQVKTFLTRGTFITAATLYTRFSLSQHSWHVPFYQGGKGVTFPSPFSRRLPRLCERRDVDYLESFP